MLREDAYRPEFMFLRKLAGIESEFLGTWFDQSPYTPWIDGGMRAVQDSWDAVLDGFTARLIFQSGGAALFGSGVAYNPFTDEFEGTIDLSQSVIGDLETEAASHGDVEGFWNAVARYIESTKGIANLTTAEETWLDDAVDSSSSSALGWSDIVDTLGVYAQAGTSGNDTLTGTRWDDDLAGLYGSGGNDTLSGLDGNDRLFGGSDDDILDGGAGNDILYGGEGDDTYRYSYGHDVIEEAGGSYIGDTDIIEMDTGISVGDVRLVMGNGGNYPMHHLIIEVAGRGTITIKDDNTAGTDMNALIDEIHFADTTVKALADFDIVFYGSSGDDGMQGSTWAGAGITTLLGFAGNDALTGNPGEDNIFDGGEGDDLLTGSTGDDVFIVSAGTDTAYAGGGTDIIEVPDGFDSEDISFYRVDLSGAGTSFDDAMITVAGLGSVIIENQFQTDTTYRIGTLTFADGLSADIDLEEAVYTLIDTAGNDSINDNYGWTGNQDDNYLFGQGEDIISDNYGGFDKVIFDAGVAPEDITLYQTKLSPSNNSLVIEDMQGNSATVYNQFIAYQNNQFAIEQLVFADGTVWNMNSLEVEFHGTDSADNISSEDVGDASADDAIYAYAGNDQVNGNLGDDIIFGGDGNDSLSGGAGNDLLNGGDGTDDLYGDAGNDTFVHEGGIDTLYEDYSDTGFDTVHLSGRVSIYDITVDDTGAYDLKLVITASSDEVVLNNFLHNSLGHHFEALSFENGMVLPLLDYTSWWYGTTGGDVKYSTGGVDVYLGDAGNDTLYGGGNKDILDGGDGNDILRGGDDSDQLFGGAGDDDIEGEDGGDFIDGEAGNDDLEGLNGEDVIKGGAGTDTIRGGADNDTLYGGDDNDTIYGGQNSSDNFTYDDDIIFGEGGNDTLWGLKGNDILDGGAGDDNLRGGEGDDVYLASTGLDWILEEGGYDTISFFNMTELTVNDIEFLNDPNDLNDHIVVIDTGVNQITVENQKSSNTDQHIEELRFHDGFFADFTDFDNEWQDGTNAGETLNGSNSVDDVIRLKDGDDTSYGYDGDDHIHGGLGADTIYGGDGNDLLHGGQGADILRGEDGQDLLFGGAGNDLIYGNEDNDILYGGDGDDDLRGGTVSSDSFSSDDELHGEAGNDSLYGFLGADLLDGGEGNDDMRGGAGDDTYLFTSGLDYVYDEGGTDTIQFAAGIDINDLSFAASTIDTTDLIITLNAGFDEIEVENQLGTNTAQYIDTLRFADGATASFDLYDGWVFGTASGETLNGGSTKDIILLGAGNDTSNGNDGDDELFGGEGNDTLRGYGDNDILVGGDGTDLLYGGDGNDFLYAGAGNLDRLEGGNGADTFVLAGDDALNGLNRIIDFDGTESDALQLVDVLFGYDPVTSAINDFVTLTESGGNTNLYVDRDGAHETYTAQHVARFEGVTGEWTDAADMLSQGELAVVV